MPLVPIDLRPGVFKNGTAYAGRGRWADSNLVRWKDNAIRPVGGWQRRVDSSSDPIPALFSDAAVEAPRNVIAWTTLAGARQIVIGTNLGVYQVSSTGVVTDITPSGFTGGSKGSTFQFGYGIGPYGAEAFGTRRSAQGSTLVPAASWSFDLWGEDLIAQFRGSGPVYKWTAGTDTDLVPISAAPDDFQGVVVTDERILMGIDAGTRTVQWSDSEDRDQWTPDAINQAGSITLAGNGPLIAIAKVVNTVLVVGSGDAHAGRYLGPPFVYGFERVSDSCGIVSANALVLGDRFAMWPCGRNMWKFDGAQVTPVRSDVVDFFLRDLNLSEISKTYGFQIRDFQELWWVYQSLTSPTGEPDSYICYDYVQDHWTRGKLDRAIGTDRNSALLDPLMVSPDGRMFNHELSAVAITDGPAPFCETAPIELAQGDHLAFVDYLYPDAERAPQLQAILKASDMPQDPERVYGPFSMTNPVPVRVRGRQVKLRFEGRDSEWAIGSMRIDVKPGSRR